MVLGYETNIGLIYYGPKWSWAEMVMGRNDAESFELHLPLWSKYPEKERHLKGMEFVDLFVFFSIFLFHLLQLFGEMVLLLI